MQEREATDRRQQNVQAVWRRSRACATGECVEVAALPDGVALRNSRSPGVALTFTTTEWREFLRGAKAGDFDDVLGAD